MELKSPVTGLPGGAVVESLPDDAGHTGLRPGPGRSHMPRSGWAREPWPLSLRVRSLCSATGEATTVRGPHTAKNKTNKKNFIFVPFYFHFIEEETEAQKHEANCR